MRKFFERLGAFTYFFISEYGKIGIMLFQAFVAIRKLPIYTRQVIEQFHYIGRKSFPIVIITSAFIGLALGVQIGTQMNPYTPHWMEGGLILRSILLEMGPILIGLILSGRVAAGISAELGTMKVTEQLDALRSFAIDPIEFLVMPRLVAAMLAVPMLLVFADVVGILSGFFSSHFAIALSWEGFVKGMRHDFYISDVITSLIKAYIFGIVIVLFGSYFGINSKRGAKGVGQATTLAVVWSSVDILMLDYLISAALYFVI